MLLHWLYSTNQDGGNHSLAEERAAMRNASSEGLLTEQEETEWSMEECDDIDSEVCSLDSMTDTKVASSVDEYAAVVSASLKERRPSNTSVTFPEDHCMNKPRSTSAPPSLPALDASAYEGTCMFNDEEVYGDDADTFVIPPDQSRLYLQERNGTLKNEIVAGVRTPFATIGRAGRSGKRKMGRVPGALKRTFDETTEATVSRISSNINAATKGLDVPEIGNKVLGKIFRAPEHFAALKKASRQALRKLDNGTTPEFFVFRKRRVSSAFDYDAIERMPDAPRLFAREMGMRARKALVTEGICEDLQVIKFLPEMQIALVRFYVEYKPYMTAKELFEANLRWATGEDFFSLELEAVWPMASEPKVSQFGWVATGFYLPDSGAHCKISAAAYFKRTMLKDGEANGDMDMDVENDKTKMGSSTSACSGSMHGDTEIEDDL